MREGSEKRFGAATEEPFACVELGRFLERAFYRTREEREELRVKQVELPAKRGG
tara:strand:- start:14 stop:175 length:162 start_codon:yes stop_codon:yes gene_type:complete